MKIIDTSQLTPQSIAALGHSHRLWVYNGLDCCLTHEIDSTLDSVMDPIAAGTYRLSLDLQGPILEMNMRGVLVDTAERDRVVTALERDLALIDNRFDRLCMECFNQTINPGAWQQTNKLFYEWMGLPPQKKRNSKGEWAPTTDRTALEKIEGLYFAAKPFVSHILKARDIRKQISTLTTALSPDNRYRSSASIAGTKTGRLASSTSDFQDGSNSQNLDRRIRQIFIADPGYKLCNIDLEQADARNVGAITWNLFPEYGDENRFLDACQASDLHTAVSEMCWPELDWHPTDSKHNRAVADQLFYREDSYRQASKKLGHATNFNGQPAELAKRIKVPLDVTKEFQQRYFTAFPEVKKRIEWVQEQLFSKGSLVSLFGRRRYFLKRRADNKTLNEACAFEPQSMTADEINHVMLNLFRLKKRFPDLQILLQVHDSILLQYPEAFEEEIIPCIRAAFEVALTLRLGRKFVVPCEVQVGWNWGYPEYEKETNRVIGNPNGMTKFRGQDTRVRV